MENKDWLQEYMSLKQVSRENPFTVPSGYFDDLAQRIISVKNLEELKGENTQGFTVPENYFEELSSNIQSRINIEQGLIGEETGFEVPEGYFENLSQQITGRIAVEEALMGSEEYFAVPENYFEKLNQSILDKTVNLDKAVSEDEEVVIKRKGIVRRMYSSTIFKYATAACFVLLIGTGVLINKLTAPVAATHKDSFLHKELSTISADDIKSYLQLNSDATDTQHAVTADDVPVDDKSLNSALQEYNDNVQ